MTLPPRPAPPVPPAAPAAAAETRLQRLRRRPWTLQARLMTAVIGMVAFILVMIGISTSAILSQILYYNLDASVTDAASAVQSRIAFQNTAEDVLESGPREPGTLLVMNSRSTITGAVVADGQTRALTADDLSGIADSLQSADTSNQTVDLPNLGEYLVRSYRTPAATGCSSWDCPCRRSPATSGRS